MCVIVYTTIGNKRILVKNRDRVYKPNIVIIHELVDGVELAYIKDLKTGWIEGINSNGVGIINSTLDRNDGTHKYNKNKKSFENKVKNNRILNALYKSTKTQIINEIIKAKENVPFFEGHSLIVCDEECLHIENNLDNSFIVSKINETSVFTNTGKNLKDAGFTQGRKGLSSFLRRKNIEIELKKSNINCYDDLINIMNKNYIGIDPRFHPYRDAKMIRKYLHNNLKKSKKIVMTTGQLLLNLTDKELLYYGDINNSRELKYINKLPKNYNPIIRVIINNTEKNMKPQKSKLSQKYLKKIYKKFNQTKRNNHNRINHNKTKRKNNKTKRKK